MGWNTGFTIMEETDCIVTGPVSMRIVSHGPSWSSKAGLIGNELHKPNGTLRWVGHVASRGGQHEPAPAVSKAGAIADAVARKREEIRAVAPGLFGRASGPSPDEQAYCLTQWMENRIAVEGGAPPPNPMTPEQIAIGRAAWQRSYGALRSEELLEKIAKREAAEANPVRVDLEVEPCD